MINVGDVVLIKKFNKKGTVINILKNGDYVVTIDNLKIQVKNSDLEKVNINKAITNNNINRNKNILFKTQNPFKYDVKPLEIDVHGFTLKEAKTAVDDIISKAVNQKITVIHIIHGKGSGILRNGIRDRLRVYKTKNIITKFEYAEYHNGSYGKTIVYI